MKNDREGRNFIPVTMESLTLADRILEKTETVSVVKCRLSFG